jgi:hypothetical protein
MPSMICSYPHKTLPSIANAALRSMHHVKRRLEPSNLPLTQTAVSFECTQGLLYLLFGLGDRALNGSNSGDVATRRNVSDSSWVKI